MRKIKIENWTDIFHFLLSYSILYEKYLVILIPKAAKRVIFREKINSYIHTVYCGKVLENAIRLKHFP